jgi:hypothetical protein
LGVRWGICSREEAMATAGKVIKCRGPCLLLALSRSVQFSVSVSGAICNSSEDGMLLGGDVAAFFFG